MDEARDPKSLGGSVPEFERRTELRYTATHNVSIVPHPGGPRTEGQLVDLSASGLCLRSPFQFFLGKRIGVTVFMPRGGARIEILGAVRWAFKDRAGIAIAAMPPRHRIRFMALLEEARLADPRPYWPSVSVDFTDEITEVRPPAALFLETGMTPTQRSAGVELCGDSELPGKPGPTRRDG